MYKIVLKKQIVFENYFIEVSTSLLLLQTCTNMLLHVMYNIHTTGRVQKYIFSSRYFILRLLVRTWFDL